MSPSSLWWLALQFMFDCRHLNYYKYLCFLTRLYNKLSERLLFEHNLVFSILWRFIGPSAWWIALEDDELLAGWKNKQSKLISSLFWIILGAIYLLIPLSGVKGPSVATSMLAFINSTVRHSLWEHARFWNKYTGALTWSLLLQLTAPGFFFFLSGLGEVSGGECPLEEWVGLDTFLFCGATGLSADPGGSGT